MIDEWEDFKKTVTPIDKRKMVLKSKFFCFLLCVKMVLKSRNLKFSYIRLVEATF